MDTYLASVPAAARTGWLQLNGVQGGLMAAEKLMVMYPPPKDVQTFERVYVDEHVPMAVKKLAGKTKIVATKVQSSPHCKPGRVRPLVEKFLAMAKLSAKVGMPKMRVMTDFCAERYWTLVSEMEVASMDEFERMMRGGGQNSEDMKEFENLMKGYHDLVEYGRREIYKIEG